MTNSHTATEQEEILRTARTRRDKAIRVDATTDEGLPVTWYVAYRGKFGWKACRGNGAWMDEPSDDDVEDAMQLANHVELVDCSDLPQEVSL